MFDTPFTPLAIQSNLVHKKWGNGKRGKHAHYFDECMSCVRRQIFHLFSHERERSTSSIHASAFLRAIPSLGITIVLCFLSKHHGWHHRIDLCVLNF
jgi:hypothetical protein